MTRPWRCWLGWPALAAEHQDLAVTGRSHNVAAQTTTLGKRFASAADEVLVGSDRLRHLLNDYPLRGIRTGGDCCRTTRTCSVRRSRSATRAKGGRAPGLRAGAHQRSVRSIRGRWTHEGHRCAGATGRRAVESGHHHPPDGWARPGDRGVPEGQVGSSAMPHKMNTGPASGSTVYGDACAGIRRWPDLAGLAVERGDVYCSVVRRVMLPDAFFALRRHARDDAHGADEFGVLPRPSSQKELDKYLPFLATTKIPMASGPGRRRPRDRARGDQRERGRGGVGHAPDGCGPCGLISRGWPPTTGCRSTPLNSRL